MTEISDVIPGLGFWLTFGVLFFTLYYLHNYALYWWRKGVRGPIPYPFIGNYFSRWMATMSISDYDHRYYTKYGGKQYCGFFEFSNKTLMIGDLEILRSILIKDFDNFVNRSTVAMHDPIVNKMVLVLQDAAWKSVRTILTPAFSSGKIKRMPSTIEQVTYRLLQQIIVANSKEKDFDHEMTSLLRKYAMDVVATVAFGIEVNSLNQTQDEFTTNARKIFASLPRWERFKYFFVQLFPFLAKIFKYKLRDESAPLFFKKVIEKTLHCRAQTNINRDDFLSMLCEAQLKDKEEADKEGRKRILTEEVFIAQCIVFFAAGIDTVSTTLALFLHSLAFHPRIQDLVLKEIDSVLQNYNGVVTYEALQEMKYLDMALQENERMYPSAPRTYRACKNQYKIPGTNVILEPNTTVVIPIRCIHYDQEYYADPNNFNPERFSKENKSNRPALSFLTFGQGPRNCIGMRFANLEMKMCIVMLLKDLRVRPCYKTQNPIVPDRVSGVLKVSGGVWLNFLKRDRNEKG